MPTSQSTELAKVTSPDRRSGDAEKGTGNAENAYQAALKKSIDEETLITRLKDLTEFDITLFKAKYELLEKEEALRTSSKGFSPKLFASEGEITLPSGFLKVADEQVLLICRLAQVCKYKIRVYESDTNHSTNLSDRAKLVLRGMILALGSPNQVINVSKKKTAVSEGQSFVRACQVVGMFGARNRMKLLNRSHYWFSNNPGEQQEINNRSVEVIPYKEHLKSAFNTSTQDFYELTYGLLKKSFESLSEAVQRDLMVKHTMSYGAYVNLYESQSVQVESKGRRGKNKREVRSRVPSKPKSRSLFTQGEYEAILSIHDVIFTEAPYMQKHEAFVREVWSPVWSNTERRIHDIINARSEFLRKFARITTRRLQELRSTLGVKDKRKADITQGELDTALCKRGTPLRAFVEELLKMNTVQIHYWVCKVLNISAHDDIAIGERQKFELAESISRFISQEAAYVGSIQNWRNQIISMKVKKTEANFPPLGSKEVAVEDKNIFNDLPDENVD